MGKQKGRAGMAGIPAHYYAFQGLSGDAKPATVPDSQAAIPKGSTYLEVDTGSLFYWSGSAWVALTSPALGEGLSVGSLAVVSVEQTRPADTTAYAANDVVSNSTSATTLMQFANFARAAGGSGYITGARLSTDKKSVTPRFRVHLFNASNPTVAADNAAMKELYADASKRLGHFDLPAMTTPADAANSDMSRALDMGLRHPFKCAAADRSLYPLLEVLDAFTPASGEKFTLTLYGDLN